MSAEPLTASMRVAGYERQNYRQRVTDTRICAVVEFGRILPAAGLTPRQRRRGAHKIKRAAARAARGG